MSGEVSGVSQTAGLVGDAGQSIVIQSYAVSGPIGRGGIYTAGLVGFALFSDIIQSYTVSGRISGNTFLGGFVATDSSRVRASYWDTQTSGRNNDGATSSRGLNTAALRSPTDYEDIYSTWDDGAGVMGINDNATIWCDENHNGRIGMGEMRNASHPRGDNRVWDFGTASDYPALRCTGDSLTDQRAWWYLNTTSHKPQLNQTYLDAYLGD